MLRIMANNGCVFLVMMAIASIYVGVSLFLIKDCDEKVYWTLTCEEEEVSGLGIAKVAILAFIYLVLWFLNDFIFSYQIT